MIRFALRLILALLVDSFSRRRKVWHEEQIYLNSRGYVGYAGSGAHGTFILPAQKARTAAIARAVKNATSVGWTTVHTGPATITYTSTDPDPYWKDE